jgi:uncharacterized protein YaeQ
MEVLMQVIPKVVRLDLQYNAEQTHLYCHETLYLGAYPHEDEDHFTRRLLMLLALYETHPTMAKTPTVKGPDFYLLDQQHHYLLWCALDLPSDKQLSSASRRADKVLLFCNELEQKKAQGMIRGHTNVEIILLTTSLINEFQQMIKPHMQIAVWRDQNNLTITDGELSLDVMTGDFYH